MVREILTEIICFRKAMELPEHDMASLRGVECGRRIQASSTAVVALKTLILLN
jgi:hypothetical protein